MEDDIQPEKEIIRINFPKKLPPYRYGPIVDELGFSLSEKRALKLAMEIIKPFERKYGKDIFYTFLTKHYLTINIFRSRQTGNLNLHILHGHALQFIRFLSHVINDGLCNETLNTYLAETNNIHHRYSVPLETIHMLAIALKDYIINKLEKVTSASLERGLERLVEKFVSNYKEIGAKTVMKPKTIDGLKRSNVDHI